MKQQKQPSQPKQPASDEDRKSQPGIGSSQGQDRGSTDISESQDNRQNSGDSIVGDSTGAFKERP